MDCKGKDGLKKQKEVLADITDMIKAKNLDPKEYAQAAEALKNYLGRDLTKEESGVLGVASGVQDSVKIRREDLDALGKYVDHVWLHKGTENMGAKHIVKGHLGNDLSLNELLHLGRVIREGKVSLSKSVQTGRVNHLYEKVIDGDLYYAIVGTRGVKGRHSVITFYKKQESAQVSNALNEAVNKTARDNIVIPHPPASSESIAKNGKKINSMVFPGADKISNIDGSAVDKAFAKAAQIIGKVDEAITTRISGGRIKRLATVSDITKKVGEITQDFRIAMSQVHEQAAQVKDFLDTHLSPDESVLIHQALTGDKQPSTLPEHLRETYTKIRDLIDTNADALVKAGALQEKNKIQDYLKRYYIDSIKEGGLIKKFYFDQRFRARKDLTHDERIALGMIEDANFVIPKTLAEQRVQLLKAQTLKNVADTFGSDVEKDGFVRMSDETVGGGIKKYGALAGKYVPKEVADAVKGAGIVKENMGLFETYWYPLIDHIKVNLTVKNPFTHLYNVGSNVMLSFLHGDMTALAKVLSMLSTDRSKFDALVQKANKYGLNSSLDMMEKMQPFDNKKEPIIMSILKNAYFSKGSKSGDALRHIYDWEDKIFKLASFYRQISEGVDEKTAFKISQEAYVDYTTPIPGSFRVMDKMGIMPFVHYSYKATPMVLKAVAKHPFKFAMLQAALMGTGASAWLGDNDKANMYKPSWAASGWAANAFGAKSWVQLGGGWQLNAGRLVPGMRFDGFDTLEFAGGFVGGAYRMINGETPLGYKIDTKYDSTSSKIAKRVLEMAKNYMPPITFGRYGQQFIRKATGLADPKNYYNEPMSYEEMLLRGAGVRHFNAKKELLQKARAARNLKKHEYKKAKAENNSAIARKADAQYNLSLDKIRSANSSINLDLSKF
ncbi:MAG: hypothetical protein R3331_09270 [Sulfurospirillaceae bacterium]|nr:hypothetical protein [Sulfurospirillaceae bacterium]